MQTRDLDRRSACSWWRVGAGTVCIATLGAALSLSPVARATVTSASVGFLALAPSLLAAIGVAAAVRATGADRVAAASFAGHGTCAILVAALLGTVTPLCGLSTVPVMMSLLRAGVPLAPVMAFWLSSPVTDPAMLAVTAATLGLSFALAKSSVAFLIGIGGGLAVTMLRHRAAFARPLRPRALPVSYASDDDRYDALALRWTFWREAARRRLFMNEALATAGQILPWFALALLLEAALGRWLPPDAIAPYLGAETMSAVPLAVAIGTPLYLDGYAALPLIRGLLELGMSPGAALAFLVSGGITNLSVALAVYLVVRPAVFAAYIVLAVTGSLLAGYAYDLLLSLAFGT